MLDSGSGRPNVLNEIVVREWIGMSPLSVEFLLGHRARAIFCDALAESLTLLASAQIRSDLWFAHSESSRAKP